MNFINKRKKRSFCYDGTNQINIFSKSQNTKSHTHTYKNTKPIAREREKKNNCKSLFKLIIKKDII
jgi:hypothetical protein